MTERQAQGVGRAVGALLEYAVATDALALTTTPVEIQESADGNGDTLVTLHACAARTGADLDIRLAVDGAGNSTETQLIRFWDEATGAMSRWEARKDYEVDDYIHAALL